MRSEWPLKQLQEIARQVTVGYVGSMASEYVDIGIPFLRSLNIDEFRVNSSDLKHITPKFHQRIKKSRLRPGDVVIVRTGKPGTCAVIPESLSEANCSDLVIVRCGSDIRPNFLCYWINSIATQHIASHIVGAVQQHFNISAAKTMMVAVPSLQEQDRVLEVLGSIDDRITLLRETNKTLESIAQAIFKSWFVDFDPVRAKLEGRQPEGMGEETSALFPDSFEESELGPVPTGWRILPLDEVATFLNGLALQKFPPTGVGDLPVIKIAQLRKGDTSGADSASSSVAAEYVIENGDTLFSWSGSLMIDIWCGGRGALNQHLFKVSSEKYPRWFYYLWTKHHLPNFQRIAAGKATTMGHIQRRHLSAAMVVSPPAAVLRSVDEILGGLIQRAINSRLLAQGLVDLRDTLLPRLISGRLRLPEAEPIASEVSQ